MTERDGSRLGLLLEASGGVVDPLALGGIALGALSSCSLYVQTSLVGMGMGSVSVGDGLLWLMQGNPISLTFEWVMPWFLVILAASRPGREMTRGYGLGVCVQIGSRAKYWLMVALASCLRGVKVLAALYVGMSVAVLVMGGTPGLGAASSATLTSGFFANAIPAGGVMAFVGLTAAGTVALALWQLVCTLVVGYLPAIALSVVLLAASAWASLVPLPGSWLMAYRVEPLVVAQTTFTHAYPLLAGVAVFVGLSLLLLGLGAVLLGRYEFGLSGTARHA